MNMQTSELKQTVVGPGAAVLRWPGSKWRMAGRLLSLFPAHRVYVDLFAGSAGVLLQKAPVETEVLNDTHPEVVNLWRVLSQPGSRERLALMVERAPYEKDRFEAAMVPEVEPVAAARAFLIRCWMGAGTPLRAEKQYFSFSGSEKWKQLPDLLRAAGERLELTRITQMNQAQLVYESDSPDTLFFVNPPPVTSKSLTGFGARRFFALADALNRIRGKAVIAGYQDEIFKNLYEDEGWKRLDFREVVREGQSRIESVWINFEASHE